MGGRWRKTKKVVVDREYRARRRRSYGLWLKKIKSLPKSKKKEIIRKRQVARDKVTAELWRKLWETDVIIIIISFFFINYSFRFRFDLI